MRVTPLLLRSAAAAGLALLAAACVVPPAGLAPRPDEVARGAPDVAFYSFESQPYSAGTGLLSYSLTRDAYAAVFEVDQRGRVRVLSPASPNADAVAKGGQSYVVTPEITITDPEFLSSGRNFDRIPYVFVLTSDEPFDFGAFGRGRTWSRSVTTGNGYDPDSVIAATADRVLAGGADYASDFAYVGPRLRTGEQAFASECVRPAEDIHDYRYYRDLWAVFDPQDQRLSYNPAWLFTSALGWSSYGYSMLPLALYRAQIAPNAFYGGCAAPSAPAYSYRYASAYYGASTSPYAGYAFGTYPYGWYYGGRTFAAGGTQPKSTLRLPRTPLSFTNPVAVATGPTTEPTRGQTAQPVSTGRWLLGRVPAGLGQSAPGQTALGARVFGGGRRIGESTGEVPRGFASGWGRPGVFNSADRRGDNARPVGMGFMGRGGGLAPAVGSARPTSGPTPSRPSSGFDHGAFTGGSSVGGRVGASSPGAGAAAAIAARSEVKNGSAPAPK